MRERRPGPAEKRNPSAPSSYIKQASLLAGAGILVRIIGFLYRLPLTNMIGNEGMGIYAIGYNVYNFFLILSSAGLPAAISKLVAERFSLGHYREGRQVFRVALILAWCGGLACCVALGFGADFFAETLGSPRSSLTIITLAPTTLIVAIAAVFRGYFQGQQNTAPSAISQVLEQIVNAVGSVALAWQLMLITGATPGADVIAAGAAGGTLGTGVGAAFGLAVLIWIYILFRPRERELLAADTTGTRPFNSAGIALRIVRTAAPIIIGTAIFSIANLIDTFMTTNRLVDGAGMSEAEATALFGILNGKYVTLTTLPITISTSFASAAIPGVSASVAQGRTKEAHRRINTAIRMAMLLSVPAAVGLGVLAEPILSLLFPKYPEGADLLRIGSVSVVFLALTQISTGVLQGVGRLRGPVVGAAIGVLVKIPISWLLLGIPQVNIIGAVIGTIACYMAAAAFDVAYLIRTTHARIDFMKILVKPAIASVVMGMACFVSYFLVQTALGINALSIAVSVTLGVAVYFAFMALLGGLEREDVARFPFGDRIARAIFRK
ncbi:MAG: polysaccharide biosynthesis protein [Clostridiales bacterium]|nr:polysaccharide biosynthesis protein [Clostridiales bacterium]